MYRGYRSIILHNTNKEFEIGHTHLESIEQAKLLIRVSLERRIPRHLSRYLLKSLIRINEGEYVEKVQELLDNKKKKEKYYNKSGKNKRAPKKRRLV